MTKILTLSEAQTRRQGLDKLVFTNGTFDLLHPGHVIYLQQARTLGQALFVGLNSDVSITALKGPQRPLLPQADRALILAALACVDAVIIFQELTAHRLIEALRPEVYAKGGDYIFERPQRAFEPAQRTLDSAQIGTPLPEAPLVQSYGGQVELIPYQQGYATTTLIQRIVERFGD